MNKLKAIILFLILFTTQSVAQNTVHLCVGNDHNFGVPDNPTSLAYNWKISDTSLASIDSGNGTHHILIDLNNIGVFQLVVEEIDVNGCSGFDSVLVQIHDLPEPYLFAIEPTSFCEGDSILLQVDSLYSKFLWNNNSSSIFIYADTSANYFVNVTDENGCKNTSNSIYVDVHPNPISDFKVDGICMNNPTTFVNNSTIISDNIVSSIWRFENEELVNEDSLLYTYSFAGNYFTELFVISDYGCVDSLEKSYTIYNNPIASFKYIPFNVSTLQPEINFMTNNSSYTSLLWDFGDSAYSVLTNPLHEFQLAGTYDVWLIVADSNKCVDSVMNSITMYYDFVLHVPSVFTPNNDGDNDTFGPKGWRMKEYQSYEFLVFNRWGDIIFETTDIYDSWDGADYQHGTYSWAIILIDELGALRKKAGEVLMIK